MRKVLYTYRKWYHLPCTWISVNVLAFLYVKPNSKEICEEIDFPSYFQKNADVSILAEIQGYNYLFLCGFQ